MDLTGAMLGFVVLGSLLGSEGTSLALGVIAAILVGAWLLAGLLTPEDRPGGIKILRPEPDHFPRSFV